MIFVCCSDKTYETVYQDEAYKYVRLFEWHDLLGFLGSNKSSAMTVYFHEDDLKEILMVNCDLDIELRVLADLKHIRLVYIDDDGMHSKHFPPAEEIVL